MNKTPLDMAVNTFIGFSSAIKICFRKYAAFKGRASRSEFWFFFLFNLSASNLAAITDGFVDPENVTNAHDGYSTAIVTLALVLPSLAVGVRRLHDMDETGWWILSAIIPFVGWFCLLYWFCNEGTIGPNRYAPDPTPGPTFPTPKQIILS